MKRCPRPTGKTYGSVDTLVRYTMSRKFQRAWKKSKLKPKPGEHHQLERLRSFERRRERKEHEL